MYPRHTSLRFNSELFPPPSLHLPLSHLQLPSLTATPSPLSMVQLPLSHCYIFPSLTATSSPLSLLHLPLSHCYIFPFLTATSSPLSLLHLPLPHCNLTGPNFSCNVQMGPCSSRNSQDAVQNISASNS